MKKKNGKLSWLLLFVIFTLLVPQLAAAADAPQTGQTVDTVTDLIVYQNIPQVDPRFDDGSIQLAALHVYDAGHYTKAGAGLTWSSSNPAVAAVDNSGLVTFAGQSGTAIVTVTDGAFTDRITLGNHSVIKEKGDRYDVIPRAAQGLTTKEKIGQLLMPDFRTYGGKNVTELPPEVAALVKQYHLGGILLFRENTVTTPQTAKLVYDYQAAADKFGLLISIDQEGGIVTRLQSGTDFPGNMALGGTHDPELAYRVGKAIGEELHALGINWDFAPVLDTNNNPDNPVIGVRSFGGDPHLVAELGTAYIRGLQDVGVAATSKHFPGHGDTATDSHLGLPEVPHEKERLLEVELYPFQKAMENGIDAIMAAHVTFPKIDDTKAISKKDGKEVSLPATLSYKVLTELVRGEMGFTGVISTDAMNMQAITDHFGPVDAAVRAVNAGADVLVMPVGLQAVAEGLLAAVQSGEITQERLDASVERILTLKIKRGIFKEEQQGSLEEQVNKALQIVGSPEHRALDAEVAASAVTLVKNSGDVLPLNLSADKKIVVIGNTSIAALNTAVQSHHANTTLISTTSYVPTTAQWNTIKSADAVIIGTFTSTAAARATANAQMKMVRDIKANVSVPVIAVALRNPYDIMGYPDSADAYLAQYSYFASSSAATADVIFGTKQPKGKLPVEIPSYSGGVLYPYNHGLKFTTTATLQGSKNIIAGTEFTVTYGLESLKDSYYAQDLTFTYDPALVEFVSASSLSDKFKIVETSKSEGQVRIIAASLGEGNPVNADSQLLNLQWRAKSTASGSTAITLSNAVVSNGDGAETQLDAATHNITIANVDKSALNELIDSAQGVHDAAVEGSGIGQYPAGSKAVLQAAINKAKAVADNASATQQQVEQAIAQLNDALTAFDASKVDRVPGDMNGDQKITIGDLAILARGYGKTSSDADWDQYKAGDFNGDGKIDIEDLSALARLILEG